MKLNVRVLDVVRGNIFRGDLHTLYDLRSAGSACAACIAVLRNDIARIPLAELRVLSARAGRNVSVRCLSWPCLRSDSQFLFGPTRTPAETVSAKDGCVIACALIVSNNCKQQSRT